MATTPKYTLIYFNGRGYAELSRFILAQAGVKYEDKRVDMDQWKDLKKDMPFSHLPVLDVDGELISESRAIARYLAKEHGLAGKTSLDASKADAIVDAAYDISLVLYAIKKEADPVRKTSLEKTLNEESLPQFLKNLDAILKKNNSKFLVGDALTWADISVAQLIAFFADLEPKSVEAHKGLIELKEKVYSLPAIKEWVDKRPKTEF